MIVPKPYMKLFIQFCTETSETEFSYPKGGRQPHIKFMWMGSLFWGYEKMGGYEIHGDELPTLQNSWESALKQVLEENNKSE